MAKRNLAPGPYLVPMPAVLVGSVVDGRPNFLTAAFCSVVNVRPPMIACGLSPAHRTCRGIEEHRQLSINVPSHDQVVVTDYCGLVTGDKVDKGGLFETFTGTLEAAPMISSFPLTAECRLVQTLGLGADTLYVAEIVGVYAEEEVLSGGEVDWARVHPLLFTFPVPSYWRLGEFAGRAWSVGWQHPKT